MILSPIVACRISFHLRYYLILLYIKLWYHLFKSWWIKKDNNSKERRFYKLVLEIDNKSRGTYQMTDFTSTFNSVKKLNTNNHRSWSTKMKYYFHAQELWDIIKWIKHPHHQQMLKQQKVRRLKMDDHVCSQCNNWEWVLEMNSELLKWI